MDRPLKTEPKSCMQISSNRQFSDDEVNQEVPPNYTAKVTVQNPRRKTEPSWKIARPQPQCLPTSKASEEFNWQANQSSVRERNAVMFNNPLMADVYFKVGTVPHQQKIPAHKYILATGSSVFYAMFFGGLADLKHVIEIPDVEPQAFLNLLRYKNVHSLINQLKDDYFPTSMKNMYAISFISFILYSCLKKKGQQSKFHI